MDVKPNEFGYKYLVTFLQKAVTAFLYDIIIYRHNNHNMIFLITFFVQLIFTSPYTICTMFLHFKATIQL